jgi:hypothetical protein
MRTGSAQRLQLEKRSPGTRPGLSGERYSEGNLGRATLTVTIVFVFVGLVLAALLLLVLLSRLPGLASLALIVLAALTGLATLALSELVTLLWILFFHIVCHKYVSPGKARTLRAFEI